SLFRQVGKARSVKDGFLILFKPPGWLPDYLGGPHEPGQVEDTYQKYNSRTNVQMNMYIFLQFLLALGFYALFFFKNADFDSSLKVAYAVWIVLTTLMFGFIFEIKRYWLAALEVIRLITIPIGLYLLGMFSPTIIIIVAVFCLVSLIAFWILFKKSLKRADQMELSI
ncbi:MAG: hypothetical protein AAF705_22210, partial [Bacteroidota bacterium]